MKPFASAVIVLLICGTGANAQTPLGLPASSGYQLAWSDGFDGNALNPDRWAYRTDSKMLSSQSAENVTVHHGLLKIALRKEQLAGKPYTGGGIISKQSFKYGFFEARLKIAAGSGWHSSFWLQKYNGIDTRGNLATIEMDIIENTSNDIHEYSVNTHRWVPPHIAKGHKIVDTPDLSSGFHTFGCEYATNIVRYYFDGQLVQTVDWTGEPQGDVNIWLTSIAEAMGKDRSVDDSRLPGAMYVDWVRFYTR